MAFGGYRRDDGLWEVEGSVKDVRSHDVAFSGGGSRAAGRPIHDMRIRLTVDRAAVIREIYASTEASPFSGVCDSITSRYQGLVGMRIGPGFRRQVREMLGGTKGCTHLTDLLLATGTVVMQTLADVTPNSDSEPHFSLGGCHALDTSGEIVAKFHPRWYRKPVPVSDQDQAS